MIMRDYKGRAELPFYPDYELNFASGFTTALVLIAGVLKLLGVIV